MRISYHAETESLYIDVAGGISAECVEICDGVVLDYDSTGKLVGIDIDRVSALPQVLKVPESLIATKEKSGSKSGSEEAPVD
jgi:uncharacterized protein YuzE